MMIISNERKDNVNELKKCLMKLQRWELEQLFRDGVRAPNLGGGLLKTIGLLRQWVLSKDFDNKGFCDQNI